MRTLVRVVHDADDTPSTVRALGRSHDLSAGVVVIRPTPGRGGPGIARDVLHALGKRFDIPGTPRSATALLAPAAVWLAAEQTRRLIITRAELLEPEDWTTLLALTGAGLEELWFVVHTPVLGAAHHATLTGTSFAVFEADELLSSLQSTAPSSPPSGERGTHPPVSRADFPAFLRRCAELLEPDDLRRVHETYRRGQDSTDQWLARRNRAAHAEIHAFLGHLIEAEGSLDAALSLLRGAQSRLFMSGLHLHIDTVRFVAWHGSTPHIPLSAPVSHLLRAFISTRHAALAALSALTRWGPDRLATIDIGDLSEDAAELRGGHPIPDHARALIRAHILVRARDWAAGRDKPLFTADSSPSRASTRILTDHLDTVAARTGLQFVSRTGLSSPTDSIGHWATVRTIADAPR